LGVSTLADLFTLVSLSVQLDETEIKSPRIENGTHRRNCARTLVVNNVFVAFFADPVSDSCKLHLLDKFTRGCYRNFYVLSPLTKRKKK
jgi:hypothetical protein